MATLDTNATANPPLTVSTTSTPYHCHLMQLAIAQAHQSIPVDSAYCVGALVVSPQGNMTTKNEAVAASILATGYSRELEGNTHAEECALMKMNKEGVATAGTDMYTTMEPCSKRLSGNAPCVQHIIAANIGRVFVGAREPDHFVACQGVALLLEAGIEVYDVVYEGVREECLAPNQHIAKFNTGAQKGRAE